MALSKDIVILTAIHTDDWREVGTSVMSRTLLLRVLLGSFDCII